MPTSQNPVSKYIAAAPQWSQSTLRELRKAIKAAAPQAKESLSYHMPYYNQNGRVAYFAAFKEHCSFFWLTGEDKKVFAKELARLHVVASTLRIPKGSKVPVAIIKKLVKAKVIKNTAKKQKSMNK